MSGADSLPVKVVSGSENCLPPGTRLADYEIVKVLGEGGFGIVYLAFDHSLHRNVAIKEYMPSALALRGDDHGVSLRAERHQDTFRLGLKSFINEARFLAQFDHPALVKVHRYWEQNRTAYTAMQYYDGRTVKELVASEPQLIDQAWCLRMLGDILQALEMLYTMQIVHRDVSPDNIIVQASGEAVLLDFGSARQVIGDMTKGLTVILKPGYAPVEQYAGDASLEQGAYTDIYALAAVACYAITGKAPASSIARMIQDPLVPLAQQAPPGYSIDFLSAIDRGMAVLAHDRPQSIDAFRALLGIAAVAPLRANGVALRAPAEASAASAAASNWQVAGAGARMPVGGASDAAAATGAHDGRGSEGTAGTAGTDATHGTHDDKLARAANGGHALRELKGRVLLAVAVLIVLAGGYGLVSLLRDGGEDTIMLAHSQPRSRAAAEVAAAGQAGTPAVAAPSPGTASAPANAPAASAGVAVTLAIKPWATVYIDGQERGVSPPLKRLTLTPGRHQVRLVNPGFADHVADIEVGGSATNTIGYQFK